MSVAAAVSPPQLRSVRSGGQTGVDRAALDAALALGLKTGGWCPLGRRAEDGPIAARYPLEETPSQDYSQRTAWNVRDSDGTLVVLAKAIDAGTELTVREARRQSRPLLIMRLETPLKMASIQAWIRRSKIEDLNVAGPRESTAPGIYSLAHPFLSALFSELF